MRYVTSFDPNSNTNGGLTGGLINIGSVDAGQKLLLQNLSAVNILLSFDNGESDVLFAGQGNVWTLDNFVPNLEWKQESILNVSNIPISACKVIIYNSDEKVEGTYPTSLVYFSNIGNPGGLNTTVTGTSTDIMNDGQPVGHQFIEATATGQTASSISITNDGVMAVKTLIGAALQTMVSTSKTGNSPILGSSTSTTEVLGGLLVDGTATYVQDVYNNNGININWRSQAGVIRSVLKLDSSNNVVVGMGDSNILSIRNVSGVEIAQFNAAGLNTTTGATATNITTAVINATNVVSSGSISGTSLSVTSFTNTGPTTGSSITATSGNYYGADTTNSIISASGASGTGNTRLQNTDLISIHVPQGSTRLSISTTAITATLPITSQRYNLDSTGTGHYYGNIGSFSRVDTGFFNAAAGTFGHNLGVVPTWIIVQPFGTSASTSSVIVVKSTTSTTFTIATNGTGSPAMYVAWAN